MFSVYYFSPFLFCLFLLFILSKTKKTPADESKFVL